MSWGVKGGCDSVCVCVRKWVLGVFEISIGRLILSFPSFLYKSKKIKKGIAISSGLFLSLFG